MLADLLSKTHFMEKAGTGVKRISDSCKENGNKILFDFTDSFWTVIQSNAVYEDKVPDKVPDKLTEYQKKNS